LGAPSGRLALGVVFQSVVVALGAVVLGGAVTFALEQVIPDAVPVQVEPSRVVTSSVLVLVAAAVGALVSLRRIVRLDPATAISCEDRRRTPRCPRSCGEGSAWCTGRGARRCWPSVS